MTPGMTIAERVRDAHRSGRRLRVEGARMWTAAGRPVAFDETISLAEHRGIVEYVPGDLTMTVRAGTTFAEIAMATNREAQWLPLEPWGGDAGTIGATVSTATAGPFAHAFGTPRDQVIGMEFVTGDGTTVRCGGRVVKNVAGFDLTRLQTGAWGSLGVITEVSVRLRAQPEARETIGIAIAPTRTGLNELGARLRALPFTPLASELIGARLAEKFGLGANTMLLVCLGGNARAVGAQKIAMAEFGDSVLLEEAIWPALRNAGANAAASWRWSQLPSQFGDTWTQADTSTRVLEQFYMHGNPARGVVRVVSMNHQAETHQLVKCATAFRGTVNVEQLPAAAWPLVSPATPDPLARALRDKFDPKRILNAGIMGAE